MPPTNTAQDYIAAATAAIPKFPQLLAAVKAPSDIASATKAIGLTPFLFNFGLATTGTTIVGNGLHVPVQIDPAGGGRKSLYDLAVGEEVLAGAYIIQGRVYYRYVKRDTGSTLRAADGDTYTERVTKLDGTQVATSTGSLRILDAAHGIGELAGPQPDKTEVWVLWSCVRVINE